MNTLRPSDKKTRMEQKLKIYRFIQRRKRSYLNGNMYDLGLSTNQGDAHAMDTGSET